MEQYFTEDEDYTEDEKSAIDEYYTDITDIHVLELLLEYPNFINSSFIKMRINKLIKYLAKEELKKIEIREEIKNNLLEENIKNNIKMKINLWYEDENKEDLERLGAEYNKELDKWQCDDLDKYIENKKNKECIHKYGRVYFNATSDYRSYIISEGGKWDNEEQKWYCKPCHETLIDKFGL